MTEQATALKTSKNGSDVWDTISKDQLPAGFKNRFAMLPEILEGLHAKDYEGEEPWHIRPENEWKERRIF